MKLFFAGLLTLALAACSGGGTSSLMPAQHSLAPQSNSSNSASVWSVYNYNPSAKNITPKSASFDGATASFTFQPTVFTARLTTTAAALTGDQTGKTLNDTITVSGSSTFASQNGGGCGDPPAVRFFFIAKTNGPFDTTDYWWSDAAKYVLADGTVTISQPLTPVDWSDIDGKQAASNVAAFNAAVASIREIGLSFGGDCFFENGAAGTGTFRSTFTETP